MVTEYIRPWVNILRFKARNMAGMKNKLLRVKNSVADSKIYSGVACESSVQAQPR